MSGEPVSLPRSEWTFHDLRTGKPVSDVRFDRLYPRWARTVSPRHWTPVEIARRAAQLLVRDKTDRVLDVGSGVGKFCHIGALTTSATFTGIEERPDLVRVAERVATQHGIEGAKFLLGNALSFDWEPFNAIYLFNPFYEHVLNDEDDPFPIPGGTVRSQERYDHETRTAFLKLLIARPGTRVVTYNGFGAPMPIGYRRLSLEPAGSDYLVLWEKMELTELDVERETSSNDSGVNLR